MAASIVVIIIIIVVVVRARKVASGQTGRRLDGQNQRNLCSDDANGAEEARQDKTHQGFLVDRAQTASAAATPAFMGFSAPVTANIRNCRDLLSTPVAVPHRPPGPESTALTTSTASCRHGPPMLTWLFS